MHFHPQSAYVYHLHWSLEFLYDTNDFQDPFFNSKKIQAAMFAESFTQTYTHPALANNG